MAKASASSRTFEPPIVLIGHGLARGAWDFRRSRDAKASAAEAATAPATRGNNVAYRLLATFLILKSSIRLPSLSCATSHRGFLPRPDQVSDGRPGFRYFGETGG